MLIGMMAEDHARWRAGIQDFLDHYYSADLNPEADYPEYHSEGPIEDFAKDCFWRVIHSDEVLAEMSDTRIVVESVGVSIVGGVTIYVTVKYIIKKAIGRIAPKGGGGESAAAARGRAAHKEFAEQVKAKPGWQSEQRIPGTKLRPDAIDPKGRPVELKPNTPSGRARSARHIQVYKDATDTNGRVTYYDP